LLGPTLSSPTKSPWKSGKGGKGGKGYGEKDHWDDDDDWHHGGGKDHGKPDHHGGDDNEDCDDDDGGSGPEPPVFDPQRNFKTISSIYNLTVYPNQRPIFQAGASAVPPNLFNHNVSGRVDPVGDFVGFDNSIEYFFSLAPLPEGNIAGAAITSYQITEFVSACPEVAASVVYLYCSIVNPLSPDYGKAIAPLKQVAFWRFDEVGAVLKYDAWIPNLNDWITTNGIALPSLPAYQTGSIFAICTFTQARCTGANTQWESVQQCVEVLSTKTYGTYDSAWGDNIVCRTIHLVLTQTRPDVHCAHVGPTGGGKCVDIPYPANYFNDTKLYDDPIGTTFTCSK
jgi:hypothetical protein